MANLSKAVRTGRVVLAGAALVALAACGGGGGGDNNGGGGGAPVGSSPPPGLTAVPPSAGASVDGFIGFLRAYTATQQDTIEPLDTTGFVAPTDDTGDPASV